MKRIMVTGAGGLASLNFIASLRICPEEIYVVGVDINRFRIHLAPVDAKFIAPEAVAESYIDALNKIVRKERLEFIHAQPDVEVRVLSEKRERLEASVFLPSKEAIRICQDKFESAKVWLKKDVPTARVMEIKDD